MLLSSFGPRGSSLAVISLILFGAICLYVFDLTPYHTLNPTAEKPAPSPKYRPTPTSNPPVVENFPAAARATSPADLPSAPSFNKPPGGTSAPLMIGFTRNWPVLQQAVVSYIAAGWPADQIYVVENTGTMNANRLNQLTLQNPFYLDYTRLTKILGVNVVTTPALLTFAQLQNFMMFTAMEKEWDSYFWSHMDVAVLSDEKYTVPDKEDSSTSRYSNLFRRAVAQRDELDAWQASGNHADGPEEYRETNGKWALHFFAYDRLMVVKLASYMEVGGWDTMIPYYMGDCDFYERLRMGNYRMGTSDIGLIADVGSTLDDLGLYYRRKDWPKQPLPEENESDQGSNPQPGDFGIEDERGGAGYDHLFSKINELQDRKLGGGDMARNFWQSQQQGGMGEPFYMDSDGFERALWMTIENGRKVYNEKWGYGGCDIRAKNLVASDAWRVAKVVNA